MVCCVFFQAEDGIRGLGRSCGLGDVYKRQVEGYEAALQRLPAGERELIIARVEMGLTYAELADAAGKPSADAARMAVTRALLRLAAVSYTHLRAHEPVLDLVCRLLLVKKNKRPIH